MTPSDEETTKRGPGRPPGATLRRPRVIQLSDAEYQVAQHLGNGNASAGIRIALDRAREHLKQYFLIKLSEDKEYLIRQDSERKHWWWCLNKPGGGGMEKHGPYTDSLEAENALVKWLIESGEI